MTSLPIETLTLLDLVLVAALLATVAYAIGLRREFRRFRGYNADYAAILAQTGRAVEGVERAVESVQTEGASVLAALGERIEEARGVMERLEAARDAAPAPAPAREPIGPPGDEPAETPPPYRPRPDQKPKPFAWPTVVVRRLPDGA
ncbi:hypothetical protein [Salinarimonas rosea]|uniref:hypothetical protein n=1 Tax=Salinarimonas rosea TaxID=552063 RepID=UPI00040A9011|nr:hypothetical protein [Salinarimonas rosea]